MMPQERFPVEAWAVRELGLDLDHLAQSESIFALSNGHIGVRGNLDEGVPHGLPGTYLNSFYETRPLPYAEAGYGFPETGQTLAARRAWASFPRHVPETAGPHRADEHGLVAGRQRRARWPAGFIAGAACADPWWMRRSALGP